jgi:hypothetical protein
MKRIALFAVVFVAGANQAFADYTVSHKGDWPSTWPKELEPLRKQARTLVGPMVEYQHFAIPFSKRDDFEAAWPHLLAARTPKTPIVLMRGPNFFLGDQKKAGVVIHTPPADLTGKQPAPDGSLESSIYIELVVDGDVVDLNRIPLPANTPIIDRRFPDEK